MNRKEIFETFNNHEKIYSLKRFFNGDILPIEGIITNITVTPYGIENINFLELATGEELEDMGSSLLFKKDELPKLRKYILTLELEKLPKEIEIKEKELKHLKRKYERYKKQYEEESRKLENE